MPHLPKTFSPNTVQGISSILADTESGLSNAEINRIGHQSGLPTIEIEMGYSKKNRLHDMFAESQNKRKDNQAIVNFILLSCDPSRYVGRQDEFETLRSNINQLLSFQGVAIDQRGKFILIKSATTIREAERRASELRQDLVSRNAHPEVLKYCRAELLDEDYFHAVLEAVKGLTSRVKSITGNDIDGQQLFDRAFGGQSPVWVINEYSCETHRMEQTGFVGLCKGIIGMFRNPLAHEPRAYWPMLEQDAADVLSTLSLVHRRLDTARMLPRV